MNKVKLFSGKIKNKKKFHISIGHSTSIGNIQIFEDTSENKEFDIESNFVIAEEFNNNNLKFYAIIEFEKPILCYKNAIYIASKLDSDINKNLCRIAFNGRVFDPTLDVSKLKIFKYKEKLFDIDRIVDDKKLIGKNLIQKNKNLGIL
jgi:selenocysteine-specific elongation factor